MRPMSSRRVTETMTSAGIAANSKLPSLEVVNKGQVTLPLGPRHLIQADHVEWLPWTMLQTPLDRPLHGCRDRLPVDPEVHRCLSPRQGACQDDNTPRQGSRDSLPTVRPRKVFDHGATGHAPHPPRLVPQDKLLVAHGQVAPFPSSLLGVDLSAPPRTAPAGQQPPRNPIDDRYQPGPLLLDHHYPVGFQAKPLPDTSLQAHRLFGPSFAGISTHEGTRRPMRSTV